ncbi:MAG: hypothetical protein H6658_10650 [Ardenticatenaceae bacterium]|nr:hypothetical protein [Ardenticatenaceae bacterium]
MSDQFDWRTDDEVWTDEPVQEEAVVGTAVPRRMSWFYALALLLLLALIGRIAYHQMGVRVEAAQKAIEEDILLTHDLVRQANERRDVELLFSLLSGRDRNWTELQLELAAEGQLFDRKALGLQATADIENVQVTIAPDLEAAELGYEQLYTTQNADGVTETVRLQQTAVYRRGDQWLYAPPTAEFWGELQLLENPFFTITYYQRDELLVKQLAADLEVLVTTVCRLPDIDCPPRLHLSLRFINEPEALLSTADPATLLNHTLNLSLPAPSLIGLPMDEASYQALLRGYSLHVAAAIISQQAGYACCQHGLFHRAFLDWQLYQLYLRPWPLQTADYAQILYGSLHLSDIRQSWNVDINSPDWREVYVLVHFIAANPRHLSPMASQRLLNEDLFYGSWLAQVVGEDNQTALLQFIIDQSNLSSDNEPPIPLPQEDIVYICHNELRRFDVHTQQVRPLATADDTTSYWELWPLRQGFLLASQSFDLAEQKVRSQLFRVEGNGRYTTLYDANSTATFGEAIVFNQVIDPTERYILITRQTNGPQYSWALLDSTDCENDVCRTYGLSGQPYWSPTGQHTLLRDETDYFKTYPPRSPLYLANAMGQSSADFADDVTSFAWLDDQTVVYIRFDGDEQIIVRHALNSNLEQVIARRSDLQQLVEAPLQLFAVQVNPADNSTLLITATTEQQSGEMYFSVNQREDELVVELLPIAPNSFGGYFTPDGRFLVTLRSELHTGEPASLFTFFDLATGQQTTLSSAAWSLDWSADESWIVAAHDHYLLLVAPAYNYAQAIPGDFADCRNLIWVSQ